jgi:2-(1,2-epoxy-1,2-dihydrophenyl)acetyl-CoA isomerase
VSDVIAERHDSVLLCRLNRPESLNGLTGALLTEYLTVLEDARADDTVRVVVTTGEGDAFSAGADVTDLASETPEQGLNERMHQRFGLTTSLSLADRVFDRLGIGRQTLALKNYDKPLIAAVNGAAAGGGFALAMLHDIRLASERAHLTTAFVHLGLVADMGLTYTLPRAIGLEAAMDLMYTGRRVSAEEAQTMGLVRRVVAHDPYWTRQWRMPTSWLKRHPSQCNSQSGHWRVHLRTPLSLNLSWSGPTRSPRSARTTRGRALPPSRNGAVQPSAEASSVRA